MATPTDPTNSTPAASPTPPTGRELAALLGRVGAWTFEFDKMSAAESIDAARRIDALGYRCLWIPESVTSREIFTHATLLLSATSRLIVAAGIANIHARDPVAMANGARLLADAFPGRFILGLGVSHKPAVERLGGSYGRPIEEMTAYLDALAGAPFVGPAAASPAPFVLAALGPRMLELSAARTAGAHPYFVPVEHTAFAREHVGPDALLAPEMAVALEEDPTVARAVARGHMRRYLRLANYANNLRRLGWSDADMDGDGSDRLVDAIVAWGPTTDVVARVRRHLSDGADHVGIQALPSERRSQLDQLEELAAALL
jgi:probable F420-dependent oxidoreductase